MAALPVAGLVQERNQKTRQGHQGEHDNIKIVTYFIIIPISIFRTIILSLNNRCERL